MKKAAEYDGIPNRVLKRFTNNAGVTLTNIIKAMLRLRSSSERWTSLQVNVILKSRKAKVLSRRDSEQHSTEHKVLRLIKYSYEDH